MTFQDNFENLSKEDGELVGKILWAAFTCEGMRAMHGTTDFNEAVYSTLWDELVKLAERLSRRLLKKQEVNS